MEGYVKIPALPFVFCPKCDTVNTDTKILVWSVSDERGLHLECDVCFHAWKGPNENPR